MKRIPTSFVTRHFSGGMLSVLKAVGLPMLYRYPYRTSAEGFQSDWSHIGKDIDSVIGQLRTEARHERRNKK